MPKWNMAWARGMGDIQEVRGGMQEGRKLFFSRNEANVKCFQKEIYH